MSKHLLLVAGSGRSGTSLFSSIVANLGFYVPEPQVAADGSNPRGFGEPQWIVDQHAQLLRRANVQATDARPTAWADTAKVCLDEQVSAQMRVWLQNQYAHHDEVVLKDPRLLWFLPLWRRVGTELDAAVHVVTMLRHPAEVVSSKLYWYPNMPLVDANRLAGWVNTMLFTERATRNHGRAFLQFEDLLEDWTQPIARISAHFEVPTLVHARSREQATADSLVDRSLHRSKATWEDLDVPEGLVHLAERVWKDLLSLTDAGASDVATLARLDKCREEYISFYRYAEHVAQSTILAARRSSPKSAVAKPVKAQPSPSAHSSPEPAANQPEPPLSSRLSLARRLIPARVRLLIPLRLKRALAELFG